MSLDDQVPDAVFKVIVIGDSAVGKSCFTLQFVEGRFKEDHAATIGVEYWSKVVSVGANKTIKLQVWDTVLSTQAGQESFRAITRTFYRNVNAVLLMYDLTRSETFESLDSWIKEVRQNADPEVCIFLVGNMSDLAEDEREVPADKASKFCMDYSLQGFMEASAKTDMNVLLVFSRIAEYLYKKEQDREEKERMELPAGIPLIQPTERRVKEKKKCC